MSLDLFNRDDVVRHLAAIPLEMERVRDTFAAGLSQFAAGTRLTGDRALPAPAASRVLWGGSGRLTGWSVFASGGAARIVLRDGRDASCDPIGVISCTADGTPSTHSFARGGVSITEALFADVTGPGVLVGAILLGAVD